MSSQDKNLSTNETVALAEASAYSVAIVVSEYYNEITFALRDACVATLQANGILLQNIVVEYAPGTFELPLAAQLLYNADDYDAVICLGCVVKGETDHDIYINQSVSNALMELSLDYNTPFVFGVLTPNSYQQAQDRAGGKHGNKGTECALAALKMLALKERLG